MAEPQGVDHGSSGTNRRRGNASKRAMAAATPEGAAAPSAPTPCGACKFLRRKCVAGCIFAPHFGSDQGSAKFAAVHKVFGASNVSKLLLHIPANRRQEAVSTICYEAQARLSDPVYGCVSTILALQQQVASLQTEVALTQNQLMNGRVAYASALENIHHHHQHQLQHPNINIGLQPAYSNNSSASTNLMNVGSFNPGFDPAMETAPSSSHSMQPLHHNLSRFSHYDEEDEHESKIPPVFGPDM